MLSACSPSIHAEFHAEDADCGGYRLWYLVHADTAAAPLEEVAVPDVSTFSNQRTL